MSQNINMNIREIYYRCLGFVPSWLSPSFLVYVLESNKNNEPGLVNYFRNAFCRFKGHSCGIVWHNPGGLEPDMHCSNCGEDLG